MKRAFGHSFGTWHSAFGIFDWNLFQVIRNSCTITNSMNAALFEKRMDSPAVSQFRGKRVHFIGVGGSGMSGLAHTLLDAGAIVTGSEPRCGTQTQELA